MDDVIYTPVYRGTRYLHHECSECKYHVKMQESVLAPLYFGDSFKFCPECGRPVVRFANIPKFEEEFNRAIFFRLEELDKEHKDKLDYYCRVVLHKDEFDFLIKQCKFAVALQENGGIADLSPSIVSVAKMSSKSWNHWEIKKLKERMRSENELYSHK